jgi:Tol biopolymer transport system component
MTPFLLRLLLFTLAALGSVNLTLAGLPRATQSPVPPLLYSNTTQLHLFETNCADWLTVCADRDRILLDGLDPSFAVAQWSPDGAFIAVRMPSDWLIYRADCLLNQPICEPHHFDTADIFGVRLAWGPDGSALAYGVAQYEREWLRIRTRGCWDGSPPEACIERNVPTAGGFPIQPDWSSNGRRLAYTGGALLDVYLADMTCLDTDDVCPGIPITGTAEAELWPSLSADGTRVLYSTETDSTHFIEQIMFLDTETGERRQLTDRDTDSSQPDWSTDDRYVAYAGFARRGDGDMNIYVLDLARGLHVQLVRNADRDMYPNWGP